MTYTESDWKPTSNYVTSLVIIVQHFLLSYAYLIIQFKRFFYDKKD